MSFGKRPTRPSRPEPTRPEQMERKPPRRPAMPSKAITGALVKVAVVTLLLLAANTAANAYLRHLGHQLNDTFENGMAEGISPTPQLALLKTPLADGWELKSCRLPKPPTLAESVMPGGERDDPFVKGITAGDDDTKLFTDRSNFLQCIAEDETVSLCDPAMREAFVADAYALAKEMDFAQTYKINSSQISGNGNFNNVLQELDAAHPELISGALKESERLNALSRERLTDTLKLLTARSVLQTSDLGYFPRSDFRDAVNSVAATSNVCARTNP